MNWEKLLSQKRVSQFQDCSLQPPLSQYSEPRSGFERDCDQITFSYPFRRLQDKTQVIPFPEYDFVHTRLTHSLEVASVGRSFGKLAAPVIFGELSNDYLKDNNLVSADIGALVAASCLAHDIGNPPFGHSGEDAISYYFNSSKTFSDTFRNQHDFFNFLREEGENFVFQPLPELGARSEQRVLKSHYLDQLKMWNDLTKYEGNANGFRILTRNCDKGINPTAALLGTFSKYPRESRYFKPLQSNKKMKSQSKYGFFQSEKKLFTEVAEELGLLPIEGLNTYDIGYHRHPLAFLMEASDDIAYGMIDFEDGCRLQLIDFDKYYELVKLRNNGQMVEVQINNSPKNILIDIASKDSSFEKQKVEGAGNFKDAISYLRGKVINVLIHECFKVFTDQYENIMTGKFDETLISKIDPNIYESLALMKTLVRKFVYNYPPVLQIEASGFEVLHKLIDTLAVSSGVCYDCGDIENARQQKMNSLLPEEYMPKIEEGGYLDLNERYKRVMAVLDYVSGMTDNFAISLYRKIGGMALHHR